jgi:peptidoglycan/LPS O-acetylase OafA/YrhL
MSGAGTKDYSLEGLRGFASLNVAIGHFLFIFFQYLAHDVRPYPGAAPTYFFEEILRFPPFTFFYLADAAVMVFFALSGYVLTRRFYHDGDLDGLGAAAVKRYVRLVFPAGASVMLAWMMLKAGAYDGTLPARAGAAGWVGVHFVDNISFIGAVFRALIGAPFFARYDLNAPLWTIQIELVGSVLLFACYALFARRSRLALIAWFMFFAFMVVGRDMNKLQSTLHYAAILAGSMINMVDAQLRRSAWLGPACLVLGVIGVSFSFTPPFAPLAALPLPDMTPYGPNLSSSHLLLWHMIGAVLLVAGVIGTGAARSVLTTRPFLLLGRLSYAIYLLHFPLFLLVALRIVAAGRGFGLGFVTSVGLAFVASFILLLFLAEVFYRYVDRPSIGLANLLSSWLAARRRAREFSRSDPPGSSRAAQKPLNALPADV